MDDVVHGVARWPGAVGVESCTYTCSHGMSPGVAILRMHPQPGPPAEFGDLVFTDGNETVVVPDCKVQGIKIERDERGFFWAVEILDRRWRWRDFGFINGTFNQYAPVGQLRLIPWTIRSPTELAELCLTAMGETNYEIHLPPGINYPGPFYPLPVINVSGVNPPVNWEGVPPAQALQQVVDRCGCRIIYRLLSDSILIAPIGAGAALPPGSIAKRLPTITAPKAPSGVGVIGAPTRYQCRLALTAVGKEWDGSYLPINLLSYAPLGKGQAQIVKVRFLNPVGNVTWMLNLLDAKLKVIASVSYFSQDGDSGKQIANALATAITKNPAFKNPGFAGFTPSVDASGTLFITGAAGEKFNISGIIPNDIIAGEPPRIEFALVQEAEVPKPTWEYSLPPLFANVRATNRLTQTDAQRLARESVFRSYQLTGLDVSGKGTPFIPGYGRVLRTMQIILQDTQVDQVVPAPQDNSIALSNPQVIPPDAPNDQDVRLSVTVNFYNGFARDVPAAVYGSIAQIAVLGHVWYPGALGQLNTPPGSQVLLPFSVEPELFLIRFGEPVFLMGEEGTAKIPNLTLQTAVLIRDPLNNQVVSFTRVRPLPGGDPAAPPAMRHFTDVQLNVTSAYDKNNKLLAWTILEQDPLVRAEHYLDGLVHEYQYKPGQTVEYSGIRALECDGMIWQLTWEVGGQPCTTTVSQNAEHSIWIPPFPARRRAEYLPPVTQVNADGERVNIVAPARGFMRGPPGGFRP